MKFTPMLTHFFRQSPELFFSTKMAWQTAVPSAAPSGGPSSTPPAAPALTPAEKADLDRTQAELAKLRNDLEAPKIASDMMKYVSDAGVNTGAWHDDPQKAIDFFSEYNRTHNSNPYKPAFEKLIALLGNNPNSEQYKVGKEIAITIGDNINQRQMELKKWQDKLSDLSENGLNKKLSNFAVDTWNNIDRMSMPEKVASAAGIFFFLKMALGSSEENTLVGPALKIGAVLLGANVLTQGFTGTSLVDLAGDKLGLAKYLPMVKDQLPEFLKTIADQSNIHKPSEIVVIGAISGKKVGDLKNIYDAGRGSGGEGKIDPRDLGLSPDQITPEHLFAIIDTVVKKYEVKKFNGIDVRDDGAFFRDYGDRTFLDATINLFQQETMDIVVGTMDPEQKEKFLKTVTQETNEMYRAINTSPDTTPTVRWDGVNFYGFKFRTRRKVDESGDDSHQYTYKLGEKVITVRTRDTVELKKRNIDLIKETVKEYIQNSIKSRPQLASIANIEPVYLNGIWTIKNGSNFDIEAKDAANGDLLLINHAGDNVAYKLSGNFPPEFFNAAP